MKYIDIQFHLASTEFYSFYIWDDEINPQLISNDRSLRIENLQHIRIPVSISSFDDQNPALQSLKLIMTEIEEFTLSINAVFCQQYNIDEHIEHTDIYQASFENFYSQFITSYATKIKNVHSYICEQLPLPSLNFLTAHFHHLVNLEHLTLKSDEMGPEYQLEETDFTPRLVELLQQLPCPQHLKTLIIETYGTAYETTENLKTSLQKLKNLESFFVYGNYIETAIQDLFCTTLREFTSLRRVHVNFSCSGGESLFHISKILENRHLNELNLIISGERENNRFSYRNENAYSTDFEFQHFGRLVEYHPNLQTLNFHIDLHEYNYYIMATQIHNEAQSNVLYQFNNHPSADITNIQTRIRNILKGINNNLLITSIDSNLIPMEDSKELMSRNRYILAGRFYSLNMNQYIQFFSQGKPLTESQSHAISNLVRADKYLLFYCIYFNVKHIQTVNQKISVIQAYINTLLNNLQSLENDHFKQNITASAYQEQRAIVLNKHASAQQAILVHTAAKNNLNSTYSVFIQQLLGSITPCFVPDHVQRIIVDYLDIKSIGKLQITTGGFFRKEMKNTLADEKNIHLSEHKLK